MITVSSARPSGVDVPAAQYHALDATSAAGTPTAPARAAAAPAVDVARAGRLVRCATTAATSATTTTKQDRPAPDRRLAARAVPALGGVGRRASGRRLVGAHTRSHQNASSSSSASGSGSRSRAPGARGRGRARRRVASHPGAAPPPDHEQPDHQRAAEHRPALPLLARTRSTTVAALRSTRTRWPSRTTLRGAASSPPPVAFHSES